MDRHGITLRTTGMMAVRHQTGGNTGGFRAHFSAVTRPDWCNGNTCGIEVKNYNIATNINGLINNVSKQAIHRAENLPAGMQQRIIIDVRGQIVTPNQERTIIKGIVERSNGVIAPTSIRFKR